MHPSIRSLRRVAVALLASALLLLPCAFAADAEALTTSAATAPTFGLAEPGAPEDLAPVHRLSRELGQGPRTVMWYVQWSSRPSFPVTAVASVRAAGATPEVTWEPWDPSAGTDQPAYRLARITAGDFDGYLQSWARAIRAYGSPVILRFAHEMNGDWYPWSEQVNGNRTGDYVAAWRHVHDVFQAEGATNVTWSWSPNVPNNGSTWLGRLFPGDRYVDQVALDGYNWATVVPGRPWTSFWDVFSYGIGRLQAISNRPIYIGEVGCPESGGDKATWIRRMFDALAAHPEIHGFTWFDYDKEANWRIDSSPASLTSFRTGVRTLGLA